MIESWLDFALGSWWRAAVGFVGDHALALSVPMTVWIVVVALARRPVVAAGVAVRRGLRELGADSLRLSGAQLVQRLAPRVEEVARRYRIMPTANGLWVTRCDPVGLAAHAGLKEKDICGIRADVFRSVAGPVRRQAARPERAA